jgi:hypothetical protein
MFGHIVRLLKSPKEHWSAVVTEPADIKSMLPRILPLAAIPAVAAFLGITFMALRFIFSAGAVVGALLAAVLAFVFQVGAWVALAFIVNGLAPTFGAQKDLGQATKLATGTMIPVWVGHILNIVPHGVSIIGPLAGLGYGAYVLFLGLPVMNGTPQDKAVPYAAASIGILFVVMMVATFLVGCPAACLMTGSMMRMGAAGL